MIRSLGPPDSKTPGNVGDIYQDIETGAIYKCTDVIINELDHQFVTTRVQDHNAEFVWDRKDVYTPSSAAYFFYGGARLDDLYSADFSNATDFSCMFNRCTNLTSIPEIDTSNGTNFNNMFTLCTSLTSIPWIDTSNGINLGSMFSNCTNLTSIPEIDTSSSQSFNYTFSGCTSLTSIPRINTSECRNFGGMFSNCTNLTSIPEIDTGNGTNFASMFNACTNLTHLGLYNIRNALTIGSRTTYGHLLTVDSLVHTIKELCKVTSSTQLTMGSANLAKIADLYCKVTDDTTEKIEMELCESTDEGAMTLADYAALKNWVFY